MTIIQANVHSFCPLFFQGVSSETGYDWTSISEEEKGHVTTKSVEVTVDPSSTTLVFQAVGKCATSTVFTQLVKVTHQSVAQDLQS